MSPNLYINESDDMNWKPFALILALMISAMDLLGCTMITALCNEWPFTIANIIVGVPVMYWLVLEVRKELKK